MPSPPLRADAQRNRAQILHAAREVFTEQGTEAPLEEIARRAGVGIATLYRRFPERTDLIRAVAIEILTTLGEVAKSEGMSKEPYAALRSFAHAALDLKIGVIMPILIGYIALEGELDVASRNAIANVQQLLNNGIESGQVRPDIVVGDIAPMIVRLSRPLAGERFPNDAALAHRQLDLYLDGMGIANTTKLPGPKLSAEEFIAIRDQILAESSAAR
ncbi:MAG: TetR/AcrR family transcriptional regulator [Corynebacteriales bacterium]|nr:TetR/AcrR family transcriptional regulator [Mycobacteriales bacterium]